MKICAKVCIGCRMFRIPSIATHTMTTIPTSMGGIISCCISTPQLCRHYIIPAALYSLPPSISHLCARHKRIPSFWYPPNFALAFLQHESSTSTNHTTSHLFAANDNRYARAETMTIILLI